MAGLNNSMRLGNSDFSGHWEDTQSYTSVKITMQSPMDGSGALQWSNSSRGQYPTESNIIHTDILAYSASMTLTTEYPTRGRYFRFIYKHSTPFADASFRDMSLNIDILYKTAPDAVGMTGVNENGSVSIRNHTYQMQYTDDSGARVDVTGSKHNNVALYSTLGDSSGYSVAATDSLYGTKSSFVSLRDSCNNILKDTLTHDLYVNMSDRQGHTQASTVSVSGAYHPGVALYVTGADTNHTWSTTKTPSNIVPNNAKTEENSVYVIVTDSSGHAINQKNPIPIKVNTESGGIATIDIQNGVTQNFVSYGGFASAYVTIFNLFTYNDGPNTTWTKVYNMSLGMIKPSDLVPLDSNAGMQLDFSAYDRWVVCNVATLPGQHRDLSFPKGLALPNGLFLRSALEHSYASPVGPGSDTLFVNGNVYTDANVTFFIVVVIDSVKHYLTIINSNGIKSLALSSSSNDAIIWLTLQGSGILVTPINGQYWAPVYDGGVGVILLQIYDSANNNNYFGIGEGGIIYKIGDPNITVTLATIDQGAQSQNLNLRGVRGRLGATSKFGGVTRASTKTLVPAHLSSTSMSAETIPAQNRLANPTFPRPAKLFLQNSRGQYLTLTAGALSLTRNIKNAYAWQVLSNQTLVAVLGSAQYALYLHDEIVVSEVYNPIIPYYFKYVSGTITTPALSGDTVWSVLSNYPTCTTVMGNLSSGETFTTTPATDTNIVSSNYTIQTTNSSGPYLTVVSGALALTATQLSSYVWTVMPDDVLCAVDGGDKLAIVCNTATVNAPLLLEPYQAADASMYYTVSGAIDNLPKLASHDKYVNYNSQPTWDANINNTKSLYFNTSTASDTNIISQYLNISAGQGQYMTLVNANGQISLSLTDDRNTAYVWTIYPNNNVVGLTADKAYALVCNTDVSSIYAEPYNADHATKYFDWSGSATGALYCSSLTKYVAFDGLQAKWSNTRRVLGLNTADGSFTALQTGSYNIGVLDKCLTTSAGFLCTDASVNANVWNILPNNVIVTVQDNYLWPMVYRPDVSLIMGELYNPDNVKNYCVRSFDTSILTASADSVKMVFDSCATFVTNNDNVPDQSVSFIPSKEGTTVNLFAIPTVDGGGYVTAGIDDELDPYVTVEADPEVATRDCKHRGVYHHIIPTGHVCTVLNNKLHVFTDTEGGSTVTVREYNKDIPDANLYKMQKQGDVKVMAKGTGNETRLVQLSSGDVLSSVALADASLNKSAVTPRGDNGNYKNITTDGKFWTVLDTGDTKCVGLTEKRENAYTWTVLTGLKKTLLAKDNNNITYGILKSDTTKGSSLRVAPYDKDNRDNFCECDVITGKIASIDIDDEEDIEINVKDDILAWATKDSGTVVTLATTKKIETNIKARQGNLRKGRKFATLVGGAMALTNDTKRACPTKILNNDVLTLVDKDNKLQALIYNADTTKAVKTEEYNPKNVSTYYRHKDDSHITCGTGLAKRYLNLDGDTPACSATAPTERYFNYTDTEVDVEDLPCYIIKYGSANNWLFVNPDGLLVITPNVGSAYVWNILPNNVVVCITDDNDKWALIVDPFATVIRCELYNPDKVALYYLFNPDKVGSTRGNLQGYWVGRPYTIIKDLSSVLTIVSGVQLSMLSFERALATTSPLQDGYLSTSSGYLTYDNTDKITLSSTVKTMWYLLPNLVVVNSAMKGIVEVNISQPYESSLILAPYNSKADRTDATRYYYYYGESGTGRLASKNAVLRYVSNIKGTGTETVTATALGSSPNTKVQFQPISGLVASLK